MLPFLTESFGNPSSAHMRSDARPGRRSTRPTSGSRARLNAEAREIVLHVRRHRGEQPRPQGRGLGRQGPRPPDRHLVGRAPRRRPHAALPREVRLRDRRAAGRPLRAGRPGRSSRRRSTTRRSSSRSCSPTTRSARSSRSPRSPRGSARARACSSTSMRSRPRRTSTSTSRRSARTCVSLGAHKFEGPKGVGALYVRHGTHILAQQQGGTQERHRRAGTENVAGAVGLAAAYELSCAERADDGRPAARPARAARDGASSPSPGVELTGHPHGAAAGPAVDHRARHRRRLGRDVARPRGDRRARSDRPARPARPRSATS